MDYFISKLTPMNDAFFFKNSIYILMDWAPQNSFQSILQLTSLSLSKVKSRECYSRRMVFNSSKRKQWRRFTNDSVTCSRPLRTSEETVMGSWLRALVATAYPRHTCREGRQVSNSSSACYRIACDLCQCYHLNHTDLYTTLIKYTYKKKWETFINALIIDINDWLFEG